MKNKSKKSPVIGKINDTASNIYQTILKKKRPQIEMPLRSLQNVKYDPKDGYFELLGKMKEPTLTASTVKTFAQSLKMMALSTGSAIAIVLVLILAIARVRT